MTHLTDFPCPIVRRDSRHGVVHHKRIATPRANKRGKISEHWFNGQKI